MTQQQNLVGRQQQRGVTLSSVIFFGIIAILLLALFFKVIPVYNQYFEVKKTLNTIMSQDHVTEGDIRKAFDQASKIGGGFAIKSADLQITRKRGRFYIGAKWKRIVPLLANVSLLFDFDIKEDTK